MKYIDAEKLIAKIDNLESFSCISEEQDGFYSAISRINDIIDSLQQEQPDFPTTDEQMKEFLATHPKVEVPEKYKTPDFVFSKQEYESHPIISKDTTSVKPAEWSEEDRLHYANVLEALEYVKGCKSDYDKIEAVKSDIAWLKLLRNRVGKDSLQPHWKPSEEQMGALNYAYYELFKRGDVGHNILGPLQKLCDELRNSNHEEEVH